MRDVEVGSLIYDVLLESMKALTEKEIHRELKNHHLTANQICQGLKLLLSQTLVCLNSRGLYDLWSLNIPSDDDVQPCAQDTASKHESLSRGAVSHDPQNPMTETPKPTNRSRERTESPSDVAGALVAAKKEDTMATVNKIFGNMQLAVPADTRVALYSSLKPEAQECYGGLQNILQVLKSATGSIKPADIAKKAGLGDSRKSANKHLYFLEKKGMIKKSEESSSPLWTIIEKGKNLTDENMTGLAAEFYLRDKKSSESAYVEIAPCSQDSRQNGAANGECKNCKRPCVNIVNENHYHNHTYVCQVGNNNTVHVPPSDGANPSVENG